MLEIIKAITTHELFPTVGIPICICLARIVDVSLGTLRNILTNRGQKLMAPMVGFVEILIWITVITQVMQHLDHWQNYFAYAFGFALGTFIGIWVEEKIALGNVILRIITRTDAHKLAEILRSKNYYVTLLDADGNEGKVNVLFLTIKRSNLKRIVPIIKENNPWAIYSIEDVRFANYKLMDTPIDKIDEIKKSL